MKKLIIPLIVLTTGITLQSQAQSTQYVLATPSTMEISGTSTLHDWECTVEEFPTEATFNTAAKNDTAATPFLESLHFSANVKSIECGKGAMNKKTYGALKEKEYPTIKFALSSATMDKNTSGDNSAFTLNVKGNLTIAGVTKPVTFPVEGQPLDNGNMHFSGSYKLNMKDFDVEPPSAVFGTIRSGEEVTVAFDIVLAPK